MTILRHLRRLAIALSCAALAAFPAAAEPYRVEAGDALNLSIFAQPELSGVHRVREDGSIVLHLIGEVPVAGMTLTEVSAAVSAAAERVFQARASVIADIAAYREIYVLGEIARPGAYPFSPGLTVIKALALAGGTRATPMAAEADGFRIVEERRRFTLARSRVKEAEATIEAIDAELRRLEAGAAAAAAPPPGTSPDAGDRTAQQNALIDARRAVMARAVDGASRQQKLAVEEAELLSQRNALVARQLELTEQNLRDVDDLVARGLARRDRQLDLSVAADDFRSDTLEIAAFEARARQTAANAENTAAIAVSRYREELTSDRIAAIRVLEAAKIDLATSGELLRMSGDASGALMTLEGFDLRYEIIRDNATMEAEESTALRPADVLRVVLAPAASE